MTTTQIQHRAQSATASPAISLTGLTKSFGSVHAGPRDRPDHPARRGRRLPRPQRRGQDDDDRHDPRPVAAGHGSVQVFGMEPHHAIRHGLVSAVMQTGGLLKDLTVRETVEYTGSLFAHTRPVDEVLAAAGLTELADRTVGKCSGGEQQQEH